MTDTVKIGDRALGLITIAPVKNGWIVNIEYPNEINESFIAKRLDEVKDIVSKLLPEHDIEVSNCKVR